MRVASAQLLEARARGVELLDLEQLEARDSAAACESEPCVVVLERAAAVERPGPSQVEHDAMRSDRVALAELDALIGREVPERGEGIDVGIRALDPTDSCEAVILDD